MHMVYKLYFPYVIVFPMHNYNHDMGFHAGIEKGKQTMVDLQADLGWKL